MQAKLPHSRNWALVASVAFIVMYGIGVFGLLHPDTLDLFRALTPFTLMASAVIVLAFQKKWPKEFVIFLAGVFVAGWGVHVLGVHSGFPFGTYEYGPTLGVQVAGTPLLMGMLWVMLIYCTGAISRKVPVVKVGKALIGALLVVLMNIALEPVAMQYEYWDWYGREISLNNYVAWFVISFIMLLIFHLGRYRKSNLVAPVLYITLLLFFTLLNYLG